MCKQVYLSTNAYVFTFFLVFVSMALFRCCFVRIEIAVPESQISYTGAMQYTYNLTQCLSIIICSADNVKENV